MVRFHRWAKLLTLILLLCATAPAHAQLAKTVNSVLLIQWTGTSSGVQDFRAVSTVLFNTGGGSWTVTVTRPVTVLVTGVAGGGGGGLNALVGQGGGGGGGGAYDQTGESIRFSPGVTYTLTVGAGGAVNVAGGNTTLSSSAAGTLLSLNGGTQGAVKVQGAGGTVAVGANGISGGDGGRSDFPVGGAGSCNGTCGGGAGSDGNYGGVGGCGGAGGGGAAGNCALGSPSDGGGAGGIGAGTGGGGGGMGAPNSSGFSPNPGSGGTTGYMQLQFVSF